MKVKVFFIFVCLITLGLNNLVVANEPIINKSITIDTFFSQEDLEKINEGKLISRMYVKYNKKKENSDENIDIPLTQYVNNDINNWEIKTDEKGFIPYELTESSKLSFYNTLVSFSKLTGMKYYSRRASTVKTLVEKCYLVKSMSGNKYDDPHYDKIEPIVENMFLQKDNKFGSLIYSSKLINEGNNFIIINTCLKPISKLMFDINKKGEYQIGIYFIYNKEKKGYYYYAFQTMKVRMGFILKMGLVGPTSFSNRLRAATVHFAKLLGVDYSNQLNPWKGKYDSY